MTPAERDAIDVLAREAAQDAPPLTPEARDVVRRAFAEAHLLKLAEEGGKRVESA